MLLLSGEVLVFIVVQFPAQNYFSSTLQRAEAHHSRSVLVSLYDNDMAGVSSQQ